MTDNEITKALKCCSEKNCKNCPCFDENIECGENLIKHVLNLINRQQAEIERYKGVIKLLENDVRTAKAEAVKGLSEKITEIFMRYAHLHSYAEGARKDYIETVDEKEIEMQSVWDVITLQMNGIAEYEEMSRLQKNIETIEKERLLTELEKDFRLLVKEMTEGKA